jgi:cell division transport system permease protein
MGFWTTAKRVGRYGLIGFVRNGFVSLAAVLIMTITLFVLAFLLISGAALRSTLDELTQKVDVTVYFTTTALEDDIASLRRTIEAQPEVANVEYISRETALAAFRERHANDQITLQALDELGDNPFGASLEVRAKDTSQYEQIASFLEDQQRNTALGASIDKINFFQNQPVIQRLSDIISTSRNLGAAIALVFGLASLLIAFNTIRLAIYTSREEIGVMNLVGASHWYVRGPFVIAGILYGVISGLIVLLLLYPITASIGPGSERFFGTFNVFNYYSDTFPLMFLIVMGSGIGIGALSSYLAVHRYLRG